MAKANEGIDPVIPQTPQPVAPTTGDGGKTPYIPPSDTHLRPGTFTLPSGNKITNA